MLYRTCISCYKLQPENNMPLPRQICYTCLPCSLKTKNNKPHIQPSTYFVGIITAENKVAVVILNNIYKSVIHKAPSNKGYDFICDGYKIDVKSSCADIRRKTKNWHFSIKENKIPNKFLLIAFDNKEELNIIKIWLIPANIINKLNMAYISIKTIEKWDAYEIDFINIFGGDDIDKATNKLSIRKYIENINIRKAIPSLNPL